VLRNFAAEPYPFGGVVQNSFPCPAWRRRLSFVVWAPCSNSAGHKKR